MIGIIDYGMGNVGSIANMFKRIGIASEISRDPATLEACDRLVLPGVGAFDAAMAQLDSLKLIGPLSDLVLQAKKPILGICLGMQLMTRRSEEGQRQGLNWIPGETIRFQNAGQSDLKIPNMGWRHTRPIGQKPIFATSMNERRFYFVHSYHVCCDEKSDLAAVATHGIEFVAAFSRANIHGVQFHPEKSHRYGKQLLTDFVSHTGSDC